MNKKIIHIQNLFKDSKNRKNILILFLLIAGLLISLIYNGQKYILKNKAAGTGDIKVTLDPVTTTTNINDIPLTVKVKLTNSSIVAKQIRVAGADIDIGLNANTFYNITNVKCSSDFPSLAKATISNNMILLSCFIPGGSSPIAIQPTTSKFLGSFDLTVKNNAPSGQATFSFARTNIPDAVSSQDISDGGATSLYIVNGGTIAPSATPGGPTATPSGTITPILANMNLNIKLKFQGILRKPEDNINLLKTRVTLVSKTKLPNPVKKTVDFVSDSNSIWNGNITFSGLIPSNDYRILIKGPKHLQKRICVSAPTETKDGSYTCTEETISLKAGDNNLNFSGIYQLSGDLSDQNGIIDSFDLSLIRNNLGKNDGALLKLADINLDEIIDSQDFSLVIESLSIANEDQQ